MVGGQPSSVRSPKAPTKTRAPGSWRCSAWATLRAARRTARRRSVPGSFGVARPASRAARMDPETSRRQPTTEVAGVGCVDMAGEVRRASAGTGGYHETWNETLGLEPEESLESR